MESHPQKKLSVDDLFSDSGPFDEQALVNALHPLITIQKPASIFFKGAKLNAKQAILAYALAKKLLKSKELIKTDIITAVEIHKATGLKKGTVDPTFKALKEDGLLVGKSECEIPTHKIFTVIELLTLKKE